jgi:hypothetical protein
VKPKQITHCSPYLTQRQTRRLLALLEANPRKADASLLKKLRTSLEGAAEGDRRHAEITESIRARGLDRSLAAGRKGVTP